MNQDQELLELSAKAAGIDGIAYDDGVQLRAPYLEKLTAQLWNPLTDDGDALRLAVKLGILDMHKILDDLIREEQRFYDRPTATRRAIVRAAAEIGRMK